MHTKRLALLAIMAAALALGTAPAWAAGFGQSSTVAVLGMPLDFNVPVQMAVGEELEAKCVRAEVSIGERDLQSALVETSLERTSATTVRVRVQARPNIDEPVVSVLLHVGCESQMSRRFVLLADPPGLAMPAREPASMMATSSLLLPVSVVVAAAPLNAAFAEPVAPRVSASSPAPAPAAPSTRAAAAQAAPTTRQAARAGTPTAARQARARPARARPVPRLQLDDPVVETGLRPEEMLVIEQALQAVSEAASAISSANTAAAAAEQQAQALAQKLEQLRAENTAQRDDNALMRERLQQAQAQSRWLWPLVMGLLGLASLAGWLSWQLAGLRREQRSGWQAAQLQSHAHVPVNAQAQAHSADHAQAQAQLGAGSFAATGALAGDVAADGHADATRAAARAAVLHTAPLPFMAAAATSLRTPAAAPAWPPPAPAETPWPEPESPLADIALPAGHDAPALRATSTKPIKPLTGMDLDAPLRDMSIEELIDLEQQAEFFIVLGQDGAAVDLLVQHIRSTGGSSPLPYLKLLEIYHRTGDREASERTRQRFNQRFNAYAPEWGANLEEGLGLQDYPGVLPRLAQAWPNPLDAMAELEVLLFRKSRGELFDLPAYREVLFLYALARDLMDREAATTCAVDLLLPLADGGEFSATSPHPYFGLDRDSVFDQAADEVADRDPGRHADRDRAKDQSIRPVDLDLSQSDGLTRIVDSMPPSRRP